MIDTTTLKVVARIATGKGHHEFDFSTDNRFAFITNQEDGTLSVIDVQKLAKIKDLKIGGPTTPVTFSPLGNALYVVNEVKGIITVVDTRTQQIATRIQTKPGIKTCASRPVVVGACPNPTQNVVYVFDASTDRLAHTISVDKGPDQIAFTDTFSYVRSSGSTEVTMIRLSTVTGQPDIVKFPGGQNAPDDVEVEGRSLT